MISLSPNEHRIIQLIEQTIKHCIPNTCVRIAGGWVRDKLLMRVSHDIDLTVDNLTGVAFVQHLQAYLKESGQEAVCSSGFRVLASNPEQSKHLEAANFRLLGYDIDVTNLRSEEYTLTSRIPIVQFGTAESDCFRRDLTINSLFYNINTREVEDLTEMGFQDLKSRRLRTPMSAKSTFLDDPLRLLRAFRFSCVLNFDLDPDIMEAACSFEVLEALRLKVTKERVTTELSNGLNSDQPLKMLELLCESGAVPVIFQGISPDSLALRLERTRNALDLGGHLKIPSGSFHNLTLAAFLMGDSSIEIQSMLTKGLAISASNSQQVVKLCQASVKLNQGLSDLQGPQLCDLMLHLKHLFNMALCLRYAYFSEEDPATTLEFLADLKMKGQLEFWERKPIFSGQDLQDIFELKPGKRIGELLRLQWHWMFENPEESQEACLAYLRELPELKK